MMSPKYQQHHTKKGKVIVAITSDELFAGLKKRFYLLWGGEKSTFCITEKERDLSFQYR